MASRSTDLKNVVEGLHNCKAVFKSRERVEEWYEDTLAWQGSVLIFSITGHPLATECYAWEATLSGEDKSRIYAVLKVDPIKSPGDAVRAAIVSDFKRHT